MNHCVFCKIIAGELPCYKVHEDEHVLAFLDIHPVTRGHTLVIPKNTTSTNIFDISSDDWSRVCEVARTLAITLENSLECDGVNLMMNNRENAGQVVDHPHVHLIPRYKGDGLIHWRSGSYSEGEVVEVQNRILNTLT